jgi:hypothetical protein
MRRFSFGICLLLFSSLFVNGAFCAQPKKGVTSFENFKRAEFNGSYILLDPILKYKVIKNDAAFEEPFGQFYGDELLQVECGKQSVVIGFSNGPSEDPNFEILVRKGKKTFSKNIATESIAMSSACQFYASGNTDNSFNMRQKFTITENEIQEIEQPFYLVDRTCKTSTATVLTTERCGKGRVVANLPKGSEVHILISEWFKNDEHDQKISNCESGKENYLVSTPFGLVGWVENVRGDIYENPGKPLSCIVFNGD